jgi:hypothetical protein
VGKDKAEVMFNKFSGFVVFRKNFDTKAPLVGPVMQLFPGLSVRDLGIGVG